MSQKKWSPQAKLEIVLKALKSEMTMNELCQLYQVAPSQVYAWKKELLERGSEIFESGSKTTKKKQPSDDERVRKQLFEKIGELTVERDFLKKAWNKFHGHTDED
jgi:transposase-like protein